MQTVTSGLQYKTSDAKSQVVCNTKLVMQTLKSGSAIQKLVMQSHKWFAIQNWWCKQSQVVCNTKLVMQTVKSGLQYKTSDANSQKWFAIQN